MPRETTLWRAPRFPRRRLRPGHRQALTPLLPAPPSLLPAPQPAVCRRQTRWRQARHRQTRRLRRFPGGRQPLLLPVLRIPAPAHAIRTALRRTVRLRLPRSRRCRRARPPAAFQAPWIRPHPPGTRLSAPPQRAALCHMPAPQLCCRRRRCVDCTTRRRRTRHPWCNLHSAFRSSGGRLALNSGPWPVPPWALPLLEVVRQHVLIGGCHGTAGLCLTKSGSGNFCFGGM